MLRLAIHNAMVAGVPGLCCSAELLSLVENFGDAVKSRLLAALLPFQAAEILL